MPYADNLVGFAFATVRGSQDLQGIEVADQLEVTPESGGHAAIVGILDHCGQPAVLYQLAPLV